MNIFGSRPNRQTTNDNSGESRTYQGSQNDFDEVQPPLENEGVRIIRILLNVSGQSPTYSEDYYSFYAFS